MCGPAIRPGWFSATDNPATRQFYTLDPAAIGAALGLPRVAPFILVAMGRRRRSAIPIRRTTCRGRRTTICPMRSPGMAWRSPSW